ncbi:MAG: hypothetical protein ACYTBJ_08915 [Planctomycetota bacterium]|jgi:hypothetical protein
MRNKITATQKILIAVIVCFSHCFLEWDNLPWTGTAPNAYAQAEQDKTSATRSWNPVESDGGARPRIRSTKTAEFYVKKDARFVSGRLLSEDKYRITVEEPDRSRIVVSTYDKKDIDLRTLHTRNVPETRYYLELAEYFAGRTWDFTDDPDDFIQAIRCYEKAMLSVSETFGRNSEKLNEIEQEIKLLEADRQVWIREAQSRASMRKLEFESEFEKRLKELEDKVDGSVQHVGRTVESIGENYLTLEKNVSDIARDASLQLQILEDHILSNRRVLDDLIYARQHYPRNYYYQYYYPRAKPKKDRRQTDDTR